MGVRNCADIGENLHRIIEHLMANDDLVRLLYYSDNNPLNKSTLSSEQKRTAIFEKLILLTPRLPSKDGEGSQSYIVCRVDSGSTNSSNDQFKDIRLIFDVFVPLSTWYIKDTNLRLFAILGEIQKSLNNKTVNGIGKLHGGDFTCERITDDIVMYSAYYDLTSYD